MQFKRQTETYCCDCVVLTFCLYLLWGIIHLFRKSWAQNSSKFQNQDLEASATVSHGQCCAIYNEKNRIQTEISHSIHIFSLTLNSKCDAMKPQLRSPNWYYPLPICIIIAMKSSNVFRHRLKLHVNNKISFSKFDVERCWSFLKCGHLKLHYLKSFHTHFDDWFEKGSCCIMLEIVKLWCADYFTDV